MNVLDLLKGKKMDVLTDMGVIVTLEIKEVKQNNHSRELEESCAANDWWPMTRKWVTYTVYFTNGRNKDYNSLDEIQIKENMQDKLGDRIKENYENRTRYFLPRRTYTIIRIDGKAFHTYTKGLQRPFDNELIEDMDQTACYLCKNIMGAKFAFVQSDEISILLTDFEDIATEAWFDNNLQKMCSVSASMATSKFNQLRLQREILSYSQGAAYSGDEEWDHDYVEVVKKQKIAEFDSRVFQIPQRIEVENYFIQRQQDATRNSISSMAQSLYSAKQLHGKSSNEMQEMIFQKEKNWNDLPAKYKRGRIIVKETYKKQPDINDKNSTSVMRTRWISTECPIFTQEREFLSKLIPVNN